MKEEYKQYLQNDDKYMFHGSPVLLEEITPQQSQDSAGNSQNIDNAIFLTSSFLIASAYAFKDSIKDDNSEHNWSFNVVGSHKIPVMTMQNVLIKKNYVGYIYVFDNDGSFVNEPEESLQFKSYKPLVPKQVLTVNYKDFEKYYHLQPTQENNQ